MPAHVYAILEEKLDETKGHLAKEAIKVLNEMAARDKEATLKFVYEKEDSPLMQALLNEPVDDRFVKELKDVLVAHNTNSMKI